MQFCLFSYSVLKADSHTLHVNYVKNYSFDEKFRGTTFPLRCMFNECIYIESKGSTLLGPPGIRIIIGRLIIGEIILVKCCKEVIVPLELVFFRIFSV